LTWINNAGRKRLDAEKMRGPPLPAAPTPLQNHLLAGLPGAGRERLVRRVELVSLPCAKVLKEPCVSLRHVYFPVDCIVSLQHVLEDGATAETALVGNEGLVGISSFMGCSGMPSRAVVLSPGIAYRLPAPYFTEQCNRDGETLQYFLRYALARMTELAQMAACNRRHPIVQQLCRWFLLVLDRLPDNQLDMSQETIAHMLGVRREGVTEAAGKLQRLGAIAYCHGHITVLERRKLEQLACECYAVVKKESDRLLRTPPSAREEMFAA
jgi:CRP-like cAMP-binding protein